MFSDGATPNIGLPQFAPRDHPDFLTDFNGAFRAIDKKYGDLIVKINTLENKVRQLELEVERLQGE